MLKWIHSTIIYVLKLVSLCLWIGLWQQPVFANTKVHFSTQQIDGLLETAWGYRSTQLDSMDWFCVEALEESRTLGYSEGEGRALSLQGFREYASGNYIEAIQLLKEAEQILKQIDSKKALAQNNNFLGLVYWSKGELDKAIIYQLDFLKLGHQLNDPYILADANLNIGAIYKSCHELKLAEEYLLKAWKAQQKINNQEGIGYSLHHLARVYKRLDQFDQSYEYFQKAINIWEKIDDVRGLAYSYTELGELALQTNHDSTLLILEKAMRLVNVFEHGPVYVVALHNMGHFYFKEKNWKKAEYFFQKSLKIALQKNVHDVILDNAYKLAIIYEDKKDLKKANEYLHIQLTYQDSLNAKNQKETKDWLITKNELEHERFENEYLKTKETAQQELVLRQRIIVFCLFFILVLMAVFIWFFYKNHKKSTLINEQLLELNQAIQIKNKAIEAQSQELIKVNTELENFSAVASHDMKEPLRMIISFGKLLKRQLPKDQRSMEFIDFIVDAGERMNTLLKNLLDYAHSGGQKTVLESVNLNNVLLMAQNNLMMSIKEKNALISINENLPEVAANQDSLIQLFQNLIGNSIKFQPKNQQAIIKVSAKEMDDFVRVRVEDNGIGIPEEQIAKIFQPFQRLHSRQEYDGSGLGLATCAKIMERCDGQISVNSELGKGTVFTLDFQRVNLAFAEGETEYSTHSTH